VWISSSAQAAGNAVARPRATSVPFAIAIASADASASVGRRRFPPANRL
jgi:hypothetical protein